MRRRFFLKVCVAAGLLAASSMGMAQGPFDFGKKSMGSFISQGKQVGVEIFNPTVPGRYPAVIILHGADGMTEYGDEYRLAGRLLAKNGVVGVLVHYFDAYEPQLRPGAWKQSMMDPRGDMAWMKAVNDSITYTQTLCNVDPSRIGLMGFSLGGFLAVSTSAVDPRVKAVVEFFGGIPDQVAKKVRRLPPTLVIHGDSDTIVPVSEAHNLSRVLQRHAPAYDVAIYPCQGHSLKGEAKEQASERVRCFLNTYLK